MCAFLVIYPFSFGLSTSSLVFPSSIPLVDQTPYVSSLPTLPCSSPVCSSYAQNCTVVLESQYTIQYKEECGRRYQKVCPTSDPSDCKAVIDPGCYQVPTHTPIEVPREICYNPTGERCDRYPRSHTSGIPCK